LTSPHSSRGSSYRLTASRQLHSRILLLVVLPERRLKRLQQVGIVASQSFDICRIAQQVYFDVLLVRQTYQLPRSRAIYVSSSLNELGRPFLPTSPGGADSMNEATVACFVAMVSVDLWIVICKGNTSSCEWDGGMSMVRSVRGKRGRYGVVCCLRLHTTRSDITNEYLFVELSCTGKRWIACDNCRFIRTCVTTSCSDATRITRHRPEPNNNNNPVNSTLNYQMNIKQPTEHQTSQCSSSSARRWYRPCPAVPASCQDQTHSLRETNWPDASSAKCRC